MGGDKAPHTTVSGAVEAARWSRGRFEVILVGDEDTVHNELKHHLFVKDLHLSVVHASEKVEMDESPAKSLRRKPDSSLAVTLRLHREGKVDAVVSAGNTGAVMATALFLLNRVEGVTRPSLGSFMPHESGQGFILDVGANVDCKPVHLLQFGIMGTIFARHVMGIQNPRVGLLNIGEEPTKGNDLAQKAYRLLENSSLDFIGNVEGRDILQGKADIIICDGFTGNILLKFGESMTRMISISLKRKIGRHIPSAIGAFLLKPRFRNMLKIFDYREYGGAPLLGVKGNCIICHGRSNQVAIWNAVEEAFNMIQEKVWQKIEQEVSKMKGVQGEI